MGIIALPQFIAIDTSALGAMSKDFWSGDAKRRDRASATVHSLADDNWVIVLTFEHIQELIQHENDEVAFNRLRFLSRLPMVAKLKTFSGSQFGTVFDIDCHEIDAIVRHGLHSPAHIIQHVRGHCWDFLSGEELIGEVDEFWEMTREMAFPLQDRSIELASLLRSGDPNIMNVKLKDVPRKTFPSSKQGRAALSRLASSMASRLEKHGDQRLYDGRSTVEEFHRELADDLSEMAQSGDDSYSAITRFFGIDDQYLDGEMTVSDLGDLAHFVKILEKASGRLRLPRLSLSDIRPGDCPSWSLKVRLRERQNTADRVKGSDLIDTHLAVLALYADAVHVDKRTNDHLRQIRCRKDYGWVPEGHFRAAHYWDIPSALSSLSNLRLPQR